MWVGRQLLSGLALLLVFATLMFFFVNIAIPYDYATQFTLSGGSEAVREQLGLERPLVVRWLSFMAGLVTGDLGISYSGHPVSSLLWRRLPITLLIFVVGGVLAYVLGGWLGRLAGWHRNRLLSGGITGVSVLLYTMFPPFLVFVLAYFFSEPVGRLRVALGLPIDTLHVWRTSEWEAHTVLVWVATSLLVSALVTAVVSGVARRRGIRWLPAPLVLVLVIGLAVGAWYAAGFGTEGADLMLLGGTLEGTGSVGSAVLAVFAFVLLAFGEVMLLMRVGVEGERGEQYIQTAAAKGLSPRQIRDRHVARVASVPALTRAVTSLPYLLSGMIIIEYELRVAGVSSLLFGAVSTADVPVIVGSLVAVGALTVLMRTVMDLVHAVLDPRVGQAAR